MFRRYFHYAPSEETSEAFQFGPRQTKTFLLTRHSGLWRPFTAKSSPTTVPLG